MPYAINTDESVLRITLSGTLTNHDLAELAKEAERIERGFPVIPHRLIDVRPVTRVEITFQGVLALAQERLKLKFPNSFKSAIIATDIVHYGFARMFETLNDHPQITIAIFADEDLAMRWLAEPGHEPSRQAWTPRAKAI